MVRVHEGITQKYIKKISLHSQVSLTREGGWILGQFWWPIWLCNKICFESRTVGSMYCIDLMEPKRIKLKPTVAWHACLPKYIHSYASCKSRILLSWLNILLPCITFTAFPLYCYFFSQYSGCCVDHSEPLINIQ